MGPRTNLQVLLTWSRIRASLSDVCVRGARWLHVTNIPSVTSTSPAFFSADRPGKPKKRDGVPTAQRLCTRMHPRALLIPISHLEFSSNTFETVCSRMLESRDLLCRIKAFSRDRNRRWKNVLVIIPNRLRQGSTGKRPSVAQARLRQGPHVKEQTWRGTEHGETVTKVRESRSCNPISASRKTFEPGE